MIERPVRKRKANVLFDPSEELEKQHLVKSKPVARKKVPQCETESPPRKLQRLSKEPRAELHEPPPFISIGATSEQRETSMRISVLFIAAASIERISIEKDTMFPPPDVKENVSGIPFVNKN